MPTRLLTCGFVNGFDRYAMLSRSPETLDARGQASKHWPRLLLFWVIVFISFMLSADMSHARPAKDPMNYKLHAYNQLLDWKYTRSPQGYYYLEYLKIRESIEDDKEVYKIWYEDRIDTVFLPTANRDEPKLIESVPNPIGKIPAVILYNQRSPMRGLGVSDLTDIADLQKSIYNELSEIEQIIRISNHPSLVKTRDTEAVGGAGSPFTVTAAPTATSSPSIVIGVPSSSVVSRFLISFLEFRLNKLRISLRKIDMIEFSLVSDIVIKGVNRAIAITGCTISVTNPSSSARSGVILSA